MSVAPSSAHSSSARASWFTQLLAGLGADLRFAARMLAKNKGFAATALTTLALCIGANTAIFSMLYALVIKPLPFPEPARIVDVYNAFPKAGFPNFPSNVVQYLDFKEHADAFEHLGLWQREETTLGDDRGPSRLQGVRATAEIFGVLGVQPIVGRFFTEENHVPAADKVIVLTHAFWVAQFQEDPGVVGRTLRLEGETYEIIGVAPPVFNAFDAQVRYVRPFSWDPARVGGRYGLYVRLYGRLRPDATLGAALSQVEALEQKVYDEGPAQMRDFLDRTGHKIMVATVREQRVGPVRDAIYLLQGGVLFVLLIGCVNVANLLLARSNARRGELGIRVALGAGRIAIVRQLLIESALLTWLGAALGVALAWGALGAVNHFTTGLLPVALPFAIDGRVLTFTIGITAVMSLAIGLLPVLHVMAGNLLGLVQSQSRGASTGRGVRAMSGGLVVLQMAVALVLLTMAGLLLRSFARVVAVDPGFDARQVVTARVALSADYREGDRAQQFQQRLLAALHEIPGVTVALATATPYQQDKPVNTITVRDYAVPPDAPQPGAFHFGATPDYLEALQIRLLEGRWFNDTDVADGRRVFVVDETFARRYFPNGSAVGQHVTFGGPPEKLEDWPEIVGVVADVKHNGAEEDSGNPYIFRPLTQSRLDGLSVFLRTTRPTPEIVALLRNTVTGIDPTLPVYEVGPLEAVIHDSFNNRRGVMLLLVSFAGVALLLSAIGIYGVLAYDVSQRTREIGIRGAVGATREQIIGLVLRQGLAKTGLGLGLGLAGAFFASRYLTSLLFEVKPTDPLAYAVVSLVLLLVGLLASYLPARRAARIDPIIALRSE